MGDVVYQSRIELTERHGTARTLVMPAGERLVVGVHGGIAEHYGREPASYDPHSATLDYIVAAALG